MPLELLSGVPQTRPPQSLAGSLASLVDHIGNQYLK